jgi:transcriptional regulator with XRE-family HTH domain
MPEAISTPSRLREERQRLGLTQARFAARLGCSAGWYALVEREPAFLSRRLAERAAKLLDCTADDLLLAKAAGSRI